MRRRVTTRSAFGIVRSPKPTWWRRVVRVRIVCRSSYRKMRRAAPQTVKTLSGAGTVSGSGTLTATAGIFPGGSGAIGELTLAADVKVVGEVVLDVSADGMSDALAFAVDGTYDVSGLRLAVADPAKLDPTKRYAVLRPNGATLLGEPDVSALPDGWRLRLRNGVVQLACRRGLAILLR